jgi:hypothetical protein
VKKGKAAGTPGAMVVIISGPSAKDTIIRLLMERHPTEGRRFVVT